MRILVALLVLGAAAQAQGGVVSAMREYYGMYRSGQGAGMDSVRDRIVAGFPQARPDTQKSVLNQFDRGFTRKGADEAFYRGCAETLSRCGKRGINKIAKRYSKTKKNKVIRRVIVDALAGCGNDAALKPLLKAIRDNEPEIAAAAIRGSAIYYKVKEDRRKAAVKSLIDVYTKVTSATRGKKADSKEIKHYRRVQPAMNEALKKFSGGEELDSAEAWKAWYRENSTKKWGDPDE